MFDSASRSSDDPDRSAVPASVRGDSEVVASFVANGPNTQLVRLFERGALRLRYPRANGQREATLVNTGGGITGGDRLAIHVDVEDGACAVLTSQAAEKVYRSDGPPACLVLGATLGAGARLDWLPQETILFERAALERQLLVEMAATARLTLFEAVVLGRIAHGEQLRQVAWRDTWRIRRDGKLIFADEVRLGGDAFAAMQRPAIGAGANAVATLLHVAPDAEKRLEATRAALADAAFACGCSAWNGMLLVRFAAADPHKLRTLAARVISAIIDRPMPRAWGC